MAKNSPSTRVVADLRREADTRPLTALPSVAEQALKAANAICRDALSPGDNGAFVREIAICVELWQFAICAGLLEDTPDRLVPPSCEPPLSLTRAVGPTPSSPDGRSAAGPWTRLRKVARISTRLSDATSATSNQPSSKGPLGPSLDALVAAIVATGGDRQCVFHPRSPHQC